MRHHLHTLFIYHFTQFISLNVTHNTHIYVDHTDSDTLIYSSVMDIMLNNTEINYKTLDLEDFCTTKDTLVCLDYGHSCVDLAEYYKKTVL